MKTFKLEIVTAERLAYIDEINVLVAPGIQGQLSILPSHTPLMTMLQPGELLIRKNNDEIYWAIGGGFLEVRPDKVVILADTCEQADEIDINRAEEAKRRAEELMKTKSTGVNLAQAEASLRKSVTRLKVAQHKRKRKTIH